MQLKDKHIVITGATAGVGRELVAELAPHNRVTAVGRNAIKLAQLREAHPSISTLRCDLADLASVEQLCARLGSEGRAIDALICNAAIQNEPCFDDPGFRPEGIAGEVTTNFTSIALMVARLLPELSRGEKPAEVVLVNSTLALTPKTSSAVYCATKAALRSLGTSLRYQLRDRGVHVRQAFLPLVDTAMTAGRGRGKISAREAAHSILDGLRLGRTEHFVGKARVVHWLHRIAPGLAAGMMRRA